MIQVDFLYIAINRRVRIPFIGRKWTLTCFWSNLYELGEFHEIRVKLYSQLNFRSGSIHIIIIKFSKVERVGWEVRIVVMIISHWRRTIWNFQHITVWSNKQIFLDFITFIKHIKWTWLPCWTNKDVDSSLFRQDRLGMSHFALIGRFLVSIQLVCMALISRHPEQNSTIILKRVGKLDEEKRENALGVGRLAWYERVRSGFNNFTVLVSSAYHSFSLDLLRV